jgi:hypothetical protein
MSNPENTKKTESAFFKIFYYVHDHIKTVNDSKIFAGIMIIILNISSKFVNVKLSKTMESYLKNTFSRQLLVFTIAWMGTRDIYIAFIVTAIFTIFIDILWNETSPYCILSEQFTDYHLSLLEDTDKCNNFTKEDIEKAMTVLEKAQKIVNRARLEEDIIPEKKSFRKQTPI